MTPPCITRLARRPVAAFDVVAAFVVDVVPDVERVLEDDEAGEVECEDVAEFVATEVDNAVSLAAVRSTDADELRRA